MSKKRPGVEAAKRLCSASLLDDVMIWEKIELQLPEVFINEKRKKNASSSDLERLHQSVNELQEKLVSKEKTDNDNGDGIEMSRTTTTTTRKEKKCYISKSELIDIIVRWKFAVGKSRPALFKYLHSNSELEVKQSTRKAISLAMQLPRFGAFIIIDDDDDDYDGHSTNNNHNHNNNVEDKSTQMKEKRLTKDDIKDMIKGPVQILTKHLRGVGPATASALLTLIRPDIFCYMYDEVIDCFLPKRTYTMDVYLTIALRCIEIAQTFQKKQQQQRHDGKGWTPSRVAKTLWIASKICSAMDDDGDGSTGTNDLTKQQQQQQKYTKRNNDENYPNGIANRNISSNRTRSSKRKRVR